MSVARQSLPTRDVRTTFALPLIAVESRCAAVALGRTYLLPPLSSGGALVVQPWLRFHIHRVAGGGRPPPAPTERGVRISRTTLFGSWFTAFPAICSSFVSMVS